MKEITRLDKFQLLYAMFENVMVYSEDANQQIFKVQLNNFRQTFYGLVKEWTNKENCDILDFQAYRRRRGRL